MRMLSDVRAWEAPLDTEQVERLRRGSRDPDAEVWEEACRLLGDRAHREPEAYLVLQELLHSPLPELRLRGLGAMEALAVHRPDEVLRTVDEALAEAEGHPDPVLLLAALALLPSLPGDAGRGRLVACLFDPREGVRAAAAASLARWTSWPLDALEVLARDASVLVRGSLATALPSAPAEVDAAALWTALAEARESWFRAFVAEEMRQAGGGVGVPAPGPLAEDEPEGVRVAPARPPAAFAFGSLQGLEAELDAAPARALDVLRDLVSSPAPVEDLERLAHLARDRGVSRLCAALALLLAPSPGPASEHMGTVLESLDCVATERGDNVAATFRRFLAECLRGLQCGDVEAVVSWATFVDLELGEGATGDMVRGLTLLAELAGALSAGGAAAGLLAVEDAALRVPVELSEPERKCIRAVVDAWGELIEREIEDAISGVQS